MGDRPHQAMSTMSNTTAAALTGGVVGALVGAFVMKQRVQAASVTKAEVEACQEAWKEAIKAISKAHKDGKNFVEVAETAAGELYGYGHGDVLFKPTKATNNPFRPKAEDAMSYFVGADNVAEGTGYKGEDKGFAINGGRGWSEVEFKNHNVVEGAMAVAMGSYTFTDMTDNSKVVVEYTFGYKRCSDGKVRICLHHSSVPFTPA